MRAPTKRWIGRLALDDVGYLAHGAKPLTCISIFSGCGGAALGIAMAGFEVRVFVENDRHAADTLRRNWTDMLGPRTVRYKTQKRCPIIINQDIARTPTEEILTAAGLRVGEATVLEGGFPCQGFSTANSRRDASNHRADVRNLLYVECVRILREAMPKMFIFENVPGLVSMEHGRVLAMIVSDFASQGYSVSWDILDAADYGVPQRRRRVIIMGRRNDGVFIGARGNAEIHIGGSAGPIQHPAWFLKKNPWAA